MPSSLLWRRRAHVDEFPLVAVGVSEAVLIHESVILWIRVDRTAGSHSLSDEILNLRPTVTTQAKQHLSGFGCVADGLRREFKKLGVRKQHDENRLADDDARGSVIGELRIVRKTERLEEGHRLWQVGNGKIDEYLFVHGSPPCGDKVSPGLTPRVTSGGH